MNIYEDQIKTVLEKLHAELPERQCDVWVQCSGPKPSIDFTVYIHGGYVGDVMGPSICGSGTTPELAYQGVAPQIAKLNPEALRKEKVEKLTSEIEKLQAELATLSGAESRDEEDLGTT